MTSYIYQTLLQKLAAQERNLKKSEEASKKWFRDAAQAVAQVNSAKLLSDRPRLLPHRRIGRLQIGRMMMYYYDPKHKKTLPYYDTLPLVIPINLKKDGFIGMNLHYLPHRLRASLLDSLYMIYQDQHLDENKKLILSYRTLQSTAKVRFFQPTIKRYLLNNVRSRFYSVDPVEWDLTLMLPTERFVGASKHKVWIDSMNRLGIGM